MVSLELSSWETDGDFCKGGNSIIENFGCLPNLEKMKMCSYFIKSLAAGRIPTRLTTALIQLKVLKIYCISFVDDISFVLCLLRSSPNLQGIVIHVDEEEVAQSPISEFLPVPDYSDVTLNQLREVKLQYISGTRPEMEFIKLLLENSPILEKMSILSNINLDDEYYEAHYEVLKKLNTYRRASRNAQVIYH
ncbi:hypothetical protein ACH5RR_030327 [Cinchona calisaya]|uniref:FBD domain-containing protein n=1 Tax=Cinchona calisaya TaxID=153742 RepID=A0ABD2YWG8_9GENT